MRVMVIVKADKYSEAGELPSEQLIREMGEYNEKLMKAGIMLAGEGLHPSSKGVRVRFRGKERIVTDGPFPETKELIAGFWLWRVKSMEEAIEWIKQCPNPMREESEIEIRPIFEADDFGAEFTPELREKEANLRAQELGLGEIRFENKGDFLVAGLSEQFTPQTAQNIAKLWGRFQSASGMVSRRVEEGVAYGVAYNTKDGCQFNYLAGIEVPDETGLPVDWSSLRIGASRYAVFTHRGPVWELPQTLSTIWQKWAPDCVVKIAKAPCFERYTKEFNGQTGGMEIWVPIESKA